MKVYSKIPIYEILSELEKKETIKQRLKENIERMQDVCGRIEISVSLLEEKEKKVIKFRYFEKKNLGRNSRNDGDINTVCL